MAVHSIIPNQFTADDVRDTLNANGGAVGNNWLDYFSALARINPWSKKKPVRLNSNFPDINGTWWKAHDGNCGFNLNRITSIDEVNGANWMHELPGGAYYPCRMSDFMGYNKNAEPIIKSRISSATIEINKFSQSKFNITPDTIVSSSDSNLCIHDIAKLPATYFAAAIKGHSTFNKWREYRGGNVVTNPGSGVTIDVRGFMNGSYQLALFLATSPLVDSGDYYPMPNDVNNKTWVTVNVTEYLDFKFELTHVSRSLTGTYYDISDLTDLFRIPGSGSLYFKGTISTIGRGTSIPINTMKLLGGSDDASTGGTYLGAMKECFYDVNKNKKYTFYPTGEGYSETIYVEWDGYVKGGGSEPENGTIINGSLDIFYLYGNTNDERIYAGGSSGFDVIF